MVRLYIVRHGDPDYDTNRSDGGSLTEHGKREARALAPFFASRNITHAYASPMGRARLTAELALVDVPRFSVRFNDCGSSNDSCSESGVCLTDTSSVTVDGEEKGETDVWLVPSYRCVCTSNRASRCYVSTSPKTVAAMTLARDGDGDGDETKSRIARNNFERHVGIEDWSRELSSWRQIVPNEEEEEDNTNKERQKVKPGAIWDASALEIRTQLHDMVLGDTDVGKGWAERCPHHGAHLQEYLELCRKLDQFLERHGLHRSNQSNYYHYDTQGNDSDERSNTNIVLFCHGGLGLTILSHLLSIPLPLVHASMWLPPSSVTTILFEEHPQQNIHEDGHQPTHTIRMTPRAICIGGTGHMDVAGLSIPMSRYEQWKRPSGIKHNFW